MPRASARRSPSTARPGAARGAALLVVIVSIAIVTAIAVDLAYSTRVSLLSAANARDELRAQYLARGGAQLARLVLRFQRQLDGLSGAAGAAKIAVPRVQVWSLVPIDESLTSGLFGGGHEGGGAPGKFKVTLEDEGRKVNAQMDGIGALGPAQIAAMLQLLGDPRWDPLFDRDDPSGLRVTRPDVAVYLHDWTDQNSTTSAITALGSFEDGFGDENYPYQRGDEPYRAKNRRFDSFDELYLVAGIDDDFMDAFGKRLTVYLGPEGKRSSNSLDAAELLLSARIMADQPQQAVFGNPALGQELQRAVALQTFGGAMSMTPFQLAQAVQAAGVIVNGLYQSEATASTGAFTDGSLVYRILATGSAGAAERRVDAVVTFDPQQVKQESAEVGRLLHWREE